MKSEGEAGVGWMEAVNNGPKQKFVALPQTLSSTGALRPAGDGCGHDTVRRVFRRGRNKGRQNQQRQNAEGWAGKRNRSQVMRERGDGVDLGGERWRCKKVERR